MFKFDHGRYRFTTHVFDRILIAEPVGALNRIVHVPLPGIGAHVTERGTHTTLGCNGMTSGGKNLGNTGGRQSSGCHTQGCAQSGASCTDDYDVIAVIDNLVFRGHSLYPWLCHECNF